MMDSMEIISSFSFNPFVLCHEPTILLNASKTYIKKTATTRFSYSTNARRGIHITASPAISNSSSKKKNIPRFFLFYSPLSRDSTCLWLLFLSTGGNKKSARWPRSDALHRSAVAARPLPTRPPVSAHAPTSFPFIISCFLFFSFFLFFFKINTSYTSYVYVNIKSGICA